MVDPISDFIIKIKNAARVNHETVTTPYSNLKEAIANLLVAEGFLASVDKKKKGAKRDLEVAIAYVDGVAKLTDIVRVSKPSKRVYMKSVNIRSFKNGFGRIVLTTPKGLMTDRDARKEKLGGEVLFKVW